MFALIGIFLALTVIAAVVFAVEYFDPSFRSPSEVESVLQLPVLAAVPDKNWSPGGFGVPRPATVEVGGSAPSQGA